jgi:hypothetical protein
VTTVHLHIGAFKTGTSFIQAVLMNGREQLADLGVLWPGADWQSVVQGVQGLRDNRKVPIEKWTDLVSEIDQWRGDSSIISMEFLSLLSDEQIGTCISSLQKHRVRVILTVRDLGRQIPAQWQESVQNSSSWKYRDYVEGLTSMAPATNRYGRHFWGKQDFAAILKPWTKLLPAEDVVVVTVPPSGAPKGLLWERFCQSVGIPPENFDATIRANESLGAASAEVMRYVSAAAEDSKISDATKRNLKKVVSKDILAAHKSQEPTLLLPAEFHEWTTKRSRQMIEELQALHPTVIGDLEDLMPVYAPEGARTTTDPSTISTEELMQAAAHGILGMSKRASRKAGKGKGNRGSGASSTPAGGEKSTSGRWSLRRGKAE